MISEKNICGYLFEVNITLHFVLPLTIETFWPAGIFELAILDFWISLHELVALAYFVRRKYGNQ